MLFLYLYQCPIIAQLFFIVPIETGIRLLEQLLDVAKGLFTVPLQ